MCSRRWCRWRGGRGWGSWDTWPSIRRGWGQCVADGMVEVAHARQQWAQDRRLVRAFQQKASAAGSGGRWRSESEPEQQEKLAEQECRRLPRKGRQQFSTTDPESRFLRTAEGWPLGYTADLAVSDDHLIVATRVTQNATDNGSLVPMVEEVERHCGARPEKVTGDSGFFSGRALQEMNRHGIDLYVPDNNLSHEMQSGERARGIGRSQSAIQSTCKCARSYARRDENVSTAASGGGTGVRDSERTTRDAQVPAAWPGGSDHGVDPGSHRLQPNPHGAPHFAELKPDSAWP